MANFDLPKGDRRLRADDFKSDAFRKDAVAREHGDEGNDARAVDLKRLAEHLGRRPIEEIAALMRGLTYGEMIELAEGLWNAQLEGSTISKDILPSLLHRWLTSLIAGTKSPVGE